MLSKFFYIFFIFIAQYISADDADVDKSHLFSLKCDGTNIPWLVHYDAGGDYFIDVYTTKEINFSENDQSWNTEETNDVQITIYYQGLHDRVWWFKFLPARMSYNPEEYELFNGSHLPSPISEYGSEIDSHSWFDSHSAGPHSIKINRESLQATWLEDISEERISKSRIDPIKYSSSISQCSKVKEGDSRLWESKVNTPLDTAIKNNQKDYIDKRKL